MQNSDKEDTIDFDENRFFNQLEAQADFDYWSKMSEWTIKEALALSFGKSPEIVTWERMQGISPDVSPFARQYIRLAELIIRAKKISLFSDSPIPMPNEQILPYKFVNWAKTHEIDFPKELAEKVLKVCEAHKSPQEAYERTFKQFRGIPVNDKISITPLTERVKKHLEIKKGNIKKTDLDSTKPLHTIEENNLKEISPKQKSADLNIIGALLGLLLGKSSSGVPYSQFETQQAIIDAIHANYGKEHGLSLRNLESKFSQAKDKLKP